MALDQSVLSELLVAFRTGEEEHLLKYASRAMFHWWYLYPADDPVRKLREARAEDFLDGLRNKLSDGDGRFQALRVASVIVTACAIETTVLPVAWWSSDPILVAGTLEIFGSVALLVGGTYIYGFSFALIEVTLISAAIAGVAGLHFRNWKWASVCGLLIVGQVKLLVTTQPIDMDNLVEYTASVAWIVGLGLCASSFDTTRRSARPKRLNSGAIALAIGLLFDVVSCGIDLPGLATALHIGHSQDAITWFNAAPIPGLFALTCILATGRYRGGHRWLASMARAVE